MPQPLTRYFTIVSRYRRAPTSLLLQTSLFELDQLRAEASPRLLRAIAAFVASQPEKLTG